MVRIRDCGYRGETLSAVTDIFVLLSLSCAVTVPLTVPIVVPERPCRGIYIWQLLASAALCQTN